MTEHELARADVRAVASEAGDASGNADRASYLFENGCDIGQVIEALEWTQEQARRTAHKAARALERVRAMTPNILTSEVPS